jgi:hypothetical protein
MEVYSAVRQISSSVNYTHTHTHNALSQMGVPTATDRKMFRPLACSCIIRFQLERETFETSHLTCKPSSGASIGVPANSL